MMLTLTSKMSSSEMKHQINGARQFLRDTDLNPDIKATMSSALRYASEELDSLGSSITKKSSRFLIVSDIFNLGVDSLKSVEHEKAFFAQVQRDLRYITDKNSKLRDSCYAGAFYGEGRLVADLEHNDPSHKNAVNGIISGALGVSLLCVCLTKNPLFMLISIFVIACKFTPATNQKPSASVLGALVYNADPELRKWAVKVHAGAPVDLGYRLLNLFSKGSNAALGMLEGTVSRLERITNFQNSAMIEGQRRALLGNGDDDTEEDTSYAARRRRNGMS